MGAGVIGVTAAYQLVGDGHQVVVLDRLEAAAGETSYANAGLIAPGHSFAWASPKVPKMLVKSLFQEGQAFRFRFSLDPWFWRWSLLFLAQCTDRRARINTLRKHRLCLYSQKMLEQVIAETGIAYDAILGGLLYLYRTQQTLDLGVDHMRILVDDGQPLEILDRDGVARVDPALAPVKDKIAGAVFCPTDSSGDACMFSRNLARACEEKGAVFHYRTTVLGIAAEGDRVEKIVTDKGDFTADLYVLSLGCQSPIAVRPLGVYLPIYPVKGYSVTLPVEEANNPPTVGGVDEDNLVAYARMGDRLRITSTAEFAGYDTSHRPKDFAAMLKAAKDLLPDAGDYSRPLHYWAGLRPMTPEGTPIFGLGRHRNLYYNTGHGHMGWTMACGAARINADLIAGRRPGIDLEGMTIA